MSVYAWGINQASNIPRRTASTLPDAARNRPEFSPYPIMTFDA